MFGLHVIDLSVIVLYFGFVNGFTSKQDPKFKKLVELVDRCIVRRPNENVHGWLPPLECGGGVPWVIEARKNHLAKVRGISDVAPNDKE